MMSHTMENYFLWKSLTAKIMAEGLCTMIKNGTLLSHSFDNYEQSQRCGEAHMQSTVL